MTSALLDDDGRLASLVSPKDDRKRFVLVPFNEIALGTQSSYLVKALIPRVGLTVIYGPPKCGKSFFAFDLMMHVALNWEYRGHRVKSGAVVYCAFEGQEGFRTRVEAFRRTKMMDGASDVPFHLVASPMSLVTDHEALVASIRATLGSVNPAAVVLDTLNRSLVGSESSDQDMAAYIKAADVIRDNFSCAVVVIHHSGLDASRPRGHTSLAGAADAQLSVKRDGADNIVVTVEFMKDGPAGEEIINRLQSVDVGEDEDGEAITSCIIEAVEGSSPVSKPNRAAAMPKGAKIALAALHEAIGAVGRAPPTAEQIPHCIVKTVGKAEWRKYALQRGISTSDKESACRMALDRASAYLAAEHFIGVWGDHVWPA